MAVREPYRLGGTGTPYKPLVMYKNTDGSNAYLENYVSHISINRALDKNPIYMRHAGGTCTITFRNITQKIIDVFTYGRTMHVNIRNVGRIFTGYVESYTSTYNPKYGTYDVELYLQDVMAKMSEIRKTQKTDGQSLSGGEAFQWVANALGVGLAQDEATRACDKKIIGPLFKEGTLVEYCDVYAATQMGGWCCTKNGDIRYMKKSDYKTFGPTVTELGVPYKGDISIQTSKNYMKDMPYLRKYGMDTTKIYTTWQRENREAVQTPRANLLKNTKDFTNWGKSNFTIDSAGWAQREQGVTASSYLFASNSALRIPVSQVKNKTLTFSVWAHWYNDYTSPAGVLKVQPRLYATNTSSTLLTYKDIWLDLTKTQKRTPFGKRVSTSFKVTESLFTQGTSPGVIPEGAYFTICIYYVSPERLTLSTPKLEIGTTPTPWIRHKEDGGYTAPEEAGGVWHSSTVTSPVYDNDSVAAYGNKNIKVETALDTRGLTYDYTSTWGYVDLARQYNLDGQAVKEQTLVPYSQKAGIPLNEEVMKQAANVDLGMCCPWRAPQKSVWPNVTGISHEITPFEMRTTLTYE